MQGTVGFIGLGAMGEPMALNLLGAGYKLLVWNRSAAKTAVLAEAGARVAPDVGAVFGECTTVLMMLRNGEVIDALLDRDGPGFAGNVAGHTIVHMGTTAPKYSEALEKDILAAGGRYAEAPVSGSREPATAGQLVAMLAGDAATVADISPLIEPMASKLVNCGAVPNATMLKLAVNTFLGATMVGLMEAVNFAKRGGLDLELFQAALFAGPMASDFMRARLPMLVAQDYTQKASLLNGLDNMQLIRAAAQDIAAVVPVVTAAESMFVEGVEMGHGEDDIASVLEVYAKRSG